LLTALQLAEIEKSMQEEHRKDREALARLKRFLNPNGNAPLSATETDDDESDSSQYPQTIIATMERIMRSDPTRKWTVPTMLSHLRSEKVPFGGKTPDATLGYNFRKLVTRGKVRRVRPGAGRSPSVYRWNSQSDKKEEGSEDSPKSERATQGQPAHLQ
jgi:hypothetical protein